MWCTFPDARVLATSPCFRPSQMDLDRETVASAVVGTGGAWLLGSAVLQGRTGRWNSVQRKGLIYAGAGFLMSAAAARWLQHTGNRGIAISLMGTLFAFRGMYLLVRERAAEKARQNPRTPE
jgi:hypothetical protein